MQIIKITFLFFILMTMFACDKPAEPEFVRIHNFKFKDLTLPPDFGVGVSADAVFHNPNTIGMTISGMELDVFVDGKKATKVEQKLSVKISGKDDFSLPLKFKVPLSEKKLIKNLSQMLTGAWKKQSVKIRVKGKVLVDAAGVEIPVPVDHEDDYKFKDYL